MRLLVLISLLLSFSTHVSAAEFDIYQSGYKPLRFALMVQAEAMDRASQLSLSGVIRNDLESSQSFSGIDSMAYLAGFEESWKQIEYGDWRLIGADIVALCRVTSQPEGLRGEVRIFDPFRTKELIRINVEAGKWRVLAHRMADQIYKAALNIPGYFTSHILYVHKRGQYSDLIYMDQDGANNQAVGKDFTLLLSPDWSPDGQTVALNTYVGNHPRLELFGLKTGSRTSFGDFKGLNSTPEFSPDGRYIAATLSYTGNTDIHIYDIKKRGWRRFTDHKGIDTTPTWSPDGKWIAFVSNRSGQPQVYRKSIDGGRAQLVSTMGSYNTSPSWSPNGDRIAMISLKNWSYAVATVKPDGSDIRYLVAGHRVESPTWSPNGQMILYAAEDKHGRRVFRVPSWGGRSEAITPVGQDASDPAWSR